MAERLEGGVSRLAYGTDQGRWLGQQLSGAPAAANPFRRQPQQW